MAARQSDIAGSRSQRDQRSLNYAGNGSDLSDADATSRNMIVISGSGHLRLVVDYLPPKKSPEAPPQSSIDAVTSRLSMKHKGVRTDQHTLGGTPHIAGTRLSVAHILADLYHLGSVDAVAEKRSRVLSKDQVKEAIAYAHDFMEIACDLSEDDD